LGKDLEGAGSGGNNLFVKIILLEFHTQTQMLLLLIPSYHQVKKQQLLIEDRTARYKHPGVERGLSRSGPWAPLSSPSRTVGLTVSVSASEVGPFGLSLKIDGQLCA